MHGTWVALPQIWVIKLMNSLSSSLLSNIIYNYAKQFKQATKRNSWLINELLFIQFAKVPTIKIAGTSHVLNVYSFLGWKLFHSFDKILRYTERLWKSQEVI